MKNVIIAFDFSELVFARNLLQQLDPNICRIKIGKGMFTRFGPDWVKECIHAGFDVFLDLKFHDIPNTVADACRAAADLGVWMLNVHCLGGLHMMQAAKEAVAEFGEQRPLLIGVTILTSLSSDELSEVGLTGSTQESVLRLAELAKQAGLDGVVCSAQEASILKAALGETFKLVTPGVRLKPTADDQKRVLTPAQAIEAGSDYLVIGRPITQAKLPIEVLQAIIQQCNSVKQ